jgi:signal transduction histidine kinase/ligand-binding sensor domain-containing protein
MTRCFKELSLIFCCLSSWLTVAFADQGVDFALRVWTVEDRLPGLPLTGITQADNGYLWLSTYDKLIRFNGVDFRSLPIPDKVLSVTGPVEGVACGVPDGVWFFGNNGIGRFKPGDWSCWSAADSSSFVGRLLGLVISDDGIVRAYAERGLLEAVTAADDATTGFRARSCPVPSDDRATLGAVTAADVDAQGRVWMTAWNGLVEYVNGGFDDRSTRLPDFLVEAVSGVHAGGSGRLWINGPNGIAYLEKNIWTPIGFPENAGLVTSMLEAGDGSLWIGNPTGIYRWQAGRWTHIGEDQIPALMSVHEVIEDHEGHVWAISDGGLLSVRKKLVGRMRSDGMVTEGTAYSICMLPDGNIWAGFRGHAVRLEAETGRILQTIYLDVDLPVSAVLEDSRGMIWMGTLGGGLFKSSGTDYPEIVPQRDYSLPVIHTIYTLLEYPGLGVLVGTPQGLMAVSATGELEIAVVQGDCFPSSVKALFRDRDDTLWICSDNTEITGYFNDKSRRIFNETDGLKGYARCVYRDLRDRLWIGTTAGLFYLHDKKMHAFGQKTDGLDQSVVQIAEDRYGRIWLGTRNGLLALSPGSLEFLGKDDSANDYTRGICMLKLDVADGLPGNRALGGITFSSKIERGDLPARLLMPFDGGICVVKPEKFKLDGLAPEIVVEKISANDRVVYDNLYTGRHNLSLQPGARNVTFFYTALAPAVQGSVFYQHRVKGLHAGWSPVQRERSASFEWLPPGRHTFEVVAGSGGVWSEDAVRLSFEVQAHYWQSIWFYILIIAILAGVVFAVARAVVNHRFKLQMEMLRREESLHRERARISRDIHDDLGNGLSVVATLSELAHSDVERESAHRRLDQIYDVANELARNVDEIVWAVNPVNDSWEPFISYFEQYTEYFLGNSTMRFHFSRPPELSNVKVASKTRHHLLLAVREAIGNILKHAQAKQVNIKMSIENDQLRIVVADDGRGFDPSASAGVGHNGLVNMRRRMAEIDGEMKVDSTPGSGTAITFQVGLDYFNSIGGDIDA